MIQHIVERVRALNNKCIDSFQEVLLSMELDPWIESWMPDPIPKETYHRRLLYQGEGCELVIATWPVGVGTMIHNHGVHNSIGVVRVLKGRIYNRCYEVTNEGRNVVETEANVAEKGELVPVNRGLVHSMGNDCSDVPSMSLHFYAPTILDVTYWDPKTLARVTWPEGGYAS